MMTQREIDDMAKHFAFWLIIGTFLLGIGSGIYHSGAKPPLMFLNPYGLQMIIAGLASYVYSARPWWHVYKKWIVEW